MKLDHVPVRVACLGDRGTSSLTAGDKATPTLCHFVLPWHAGNVLCVFDTVVLSALQLSPQWKRSITSSQRHQAHLLLQANEAFTTQLANARQQILEEMQQAIQGEVQEPQLLPSRVLMLSDHVCPRS